MRRLRYALVAAAAVALVAIGGASSEAKDTAPQLLTPATGTTFKAGTSIVFHIRADASGVGSLWLYVSKSATIANTCGTIGFDVEIEPFKATSDPAVFEARPRFFDYPGFWMNTPGTYYWQAHLTSYQGGADGCLETETRSFRIVAKAAPAPTPTPTPKPAPVRKPKPLSQARLQGNYDVVTRITQVSGVDASVGDRDEFTWGFRPYCATGPCDARLAFSYRGASFDRHTLVIRLDRSGASYKGKGTAKFLECNLADVPGPVTVQLKVTKAAWIGGIWRATRVTGSYVHSTPAATSLGVHCSASRVAAAVTGTRSGL